MGYHDNREALINYGAGYDALQVHAPPLWPFPDNMQALHPRQSIGIDSVAGYTRSNLDVTVQWTTVPTVRSLEHGAQLLGHCAHDGTLSGA